MPIVGPITGRITGPIVAGIIGAAAGGGPGPTPYQPDIGTAGTAGFGVGIAPPEAVAAGYTPAAGYSDPLSSGYGNYLYGDGSVMCWIPAFYYRIGSASSPHYATYGANAVDIARWADFPSVAAANAAGYALHRAFYDGGEVQPGFFVDKYMCSNNGGTASSIALGPPLSTHSTHNPISALDGSPANNSAGTIDAVKTRGAQFFPTMRYHHAALALLATAHGQAATSDAACAWYDAAGTTNFPKGNNVNNGWRDVNDADVTFTHDGFGGGSSALTGSGTPFAKTTHNGQDCGITDLNGNMYDTSMGLTSVMAQTNITAVTLGNPVQVTAAGHGASTGDIVRIDGIAGTTELNANLYRVTALDADTIALDGIDGTGMTAYESGGTLYAGKFYALKTSFKAMDMTSGNSSATDGWGAVGVANHSDEIPFPARVDQGQNGLARRFGNGAEQVLSPDVSGLGWLHTGFGLPGGSATATSAGGSALFGQDYWYQSVINQLCPLAGMYWSDGASAGVWAVSLSLSRTSTLSRVGCRAASYL